MLKKKTFLILLVAFVLIGTMSITVEADDVIKIGISTTSLRNDWSWGQDVYAAFLYIDENYPNVEASFTDALDLGEISIVAEDWAADGYDIVVGYGYEFLDDYVAAAEAYPDTQFLISCAPHMASDDYPDNLTSVYYLEEEAGYMLGVLAASLTETGAVGALGALEIPCTVKGMNGFRQGVYDTNPDVETMFTYIGSYTDPAGEREATESMIDAGADTIWEFWLSLGVGEAARARGANYFGSHFSMEQMPDFSKADFIGDCHAIVDILELYMEGNLEGTSYAVGVESGYTTLAMNEDLIPEDALRAVEEAREKVVSGEVEVPKYIRTMPDSWPHEPVDNPEDYEEPYFGEFVDLVEVSPLFRD